MATLQIEIDRERLKGHDSNIIGHSGTYQSSRDMLLDILSRALRDTVRNGGTFVVVVSKDTITAIQHPDAKPLEEPRP